MNVDNVRFVLLESNGASKASVVVSSSSLSVGSSDDDPVTPMYSDESSTSSLLVGSKVVSRYFSVDSADTKLFVILSESDISVIRGVEVIGLVSNVVSNVNSDVSLTSLGVTLGTKIHESPENL